MSKIHSTIEFNAEFSRHSRLQTRDLLFQLGWPQNNVLVVA
jgi:hypothetical protein